MAKHLGRTLLIAAVFVIAALNIYPTTVWYGLDATEQEAVRERIREGEIELRRTNAGTFERIRFGFERWTWGDPEMSVKLGLDLQGGLLMVVGVPEDYEASESGLSREEVRDVLLNNITNRITEFETREPLIQALGTDKIQIQLPGQKDIQRAKEIIVKQAQLDFHIVDGRDKTIELFRKIDAHFDNGFVPFLEKPSEIGGPFEIIEENFALVEGLVNEALEVPGLVPQGKTIAFSPPPQPWEDANYSIYVMDEEPEMSGEYIASAAAQPDNQSPGYWMILFDLDSQGTQVFADLTEEHIGEQLGIVLDGNMISAPTIQSRIYGSGNITGNFTQEEAQDLVIALNAGSLLVEPVEEYSAIVGPTTGRESVEAGVTASIAGLLLVVLFMIMWYRGAGIIADISLFVNAVIIVGAFAYFDIILTLPGIAGLILTVGMAVDANVLIFERIREEQVMGKSLANCIQTGFEHATSAILDANITTLIAAAVLTQFGTGPVQGFAIALSIGVVSSVFAALVVTRALLDFVSERHVFKKLTMTGLIPVETKFEFLSKRRIALALSVVAIAVGAGFFGVRGADNFGVDFRAGTNARVQLATDMTRSDEELRVRLVDAGFSKAVVQHIDATTEEEAHTFLIRVSESAAGEISSDSAADESVSTRIQRALLPLTNNPSGTELDTLVRLQNVETVGPSVGAQLRADAINAIFFALLFIIIYLWFRFEWKFAVGAVAALVHDVLVVTGILAIFQQEITIPVVAALLTIIGYSLNDTIVVFDRIREDLALNTSRGMSMIDNLNRSINRTLSRTLLTSLTTLFVVVILYIFGGDAIKPFAFALIAGVIVGTYSSVFIATPVIFSLQNWIDRRKARLAEQAKPGRKKGGKKRKDDGERRKIESASAK